MKQKLKDNSKLIFIVLICIFIVGLYIFYLKNENTIKTWDRSCYWTTLIRQRGYINTEGIKDNIMRIYNSINYDDYNLLPSTILMPVYLLLDNSYLSYIMSVVLLYLIPLMIVAYLLFKKKCDKTSLISCILFMVPILFSVQLHYPIMSGYLDIVGVLLAFSIIYNNYGYDFKKLDLKKNIISAVLICVLAVIRRYYLFFVVGYFGALFITYLVNDVILKKEFKTFLTRIKNIAILGFTFTIPIVILFYKMIYRIVANNYSFMYSAYADGGWIVTFKYLFGYLGIITLIMFIGGIVISILKHKNEKKINDFIVLLTGLIALFLFLRTQNMGCQHVYILLPTFLYFITTFTVEIYQLLNKKILKIIYVVVIILLIILNFFMQFSSNTYPIFTNIKTPYKDKYRQNIRETMEFINENVYETNSKIYIVASGHIYNSETFKNYDLPDMSKYDNYVNVPNVDLRDGFSTELFEAEYLMTITPAEYHLNPKDQQVVGIVFDAVEGGILDDVYENVFTKQVEEITIKIYKKINDYSIDNMRYFIDKFDESYSDHPELFKDRIEDYIINLDKENNE